MNKTNCVPLRNLYHLLMITKQKSKNQTMKKKNLGKNFNPQGKIKEKEKLTLFLGHKSKNFMFYNEIIAEVMAH